MDIGCALTQPAHSRFWENVVSQARYSRRGQVVRPKLDRQHIGHPCSIRKSLKAIQIYRDRIGFGDEGSSILEMEFPSFEFRTVLIWLWNP